MIHTFKHVDRRLVDGEVWVYLSDDAEVFFTRAQVAEMLAVFTSTPEDAPALHPETEKMIDAFARSLKVKLARAEAKYGYSDNWLTDDWEADCQRDLAKHVAKGDPLDVAAYAAFCWARGYRTAPESAVLGSAVAMREAAGRWLVDAAASARSNMNQRGGMVDGMLERTASLYENAAAAIRALPVEGLTSGEGEPVAWCSPGQLANLTDLDRDGGVYLPIRKTQRGNFTMPLYAASPKVTATASVRE